jgi:parvulin-like peptidyl-prolyl isomerase
LKRYIFAAIAVALLSAACSGGGSAAATVNGVDIEIDTINGLVATTDTELSDQQFLDALTAVVQWNAISDAARDEFEIEPTDDEITAHGDQIFAAQGQGMTRDQFLELQQVSEDGFALYAAQLLIGEQILGELEAQVEEPTVAEAQQLLVEDPKSWTLVCAAHILVAAEEEAIAVQARLEEGELFAEVASEVSIDTGSGAAGGDLGCTPPSQWVVEFGDAAMVADIGEVVGPVESQFGFHLIRVDSRTEATTDELQSALSDLRLSEIVEAWYFAAVTGAEVEVSEEYGTWEIDPIPTIVPPVS